MVYNEGYAKYLHDIVSRQRKTKFEQSDQLSLGRLIDELEKIKADENPHVVFDFGDLIPVRFDSWRGAYDELCLNYASFDEKEPLRLSEFISMCKLAVDKVFHGYKGGVFRMGLETPVWVANLGNSGNTALVGVLFNGYQVVLLTAYREY